MPVYQAASTRRLFLLVVLGELVPSMFVGDRPKGTVLTKGQRPCPVENGGCPVASANQIKGVSESHIV
jgi:hypothetical protein